MKNKHKIVFLLIAVSLTACQCNSADPLTEIEDYYDFDSETVINNLGSYNIRISTDHITFHDVYGEISSPLAYHNHLDDFNFNGIYRIENSDKETFYFRFGWVNFYNNRTNFHHIEWLGENSPPVQSEFEEFEISTVSIEFLQTGSISVCTIGDSQTWWKHAGSLRKEMNTIVPELSFVGSNTDNYGYGHEAEGNDQISTVLNRFEHIPEADYYTLLLGTNDWKNPVDSSFTKLKTLAENLIEKYPASKIVYLTPLPTTNQQWDNANLLLQEKMVSFCNGSSNIIVLEMGELMRSNPNWSTEYLTNDGLHQTPEGVTIMAEEMALKINEDLD